MSPNPTPYPANLGITIPGAPAPQERLCVSLAAAPELADLASIFFGDLLIADMAAHHINDPEIQREDLLYLRRACWEGAIIAYARCFGKGQGAARRPRVRLADFLVHLTPQQRACHEEVLLLRDKRIGHHVSLESGQLVDIYLGVERRQPGVITFNDVFVHVETELYDVELLQRLNDTIRVLRGKVGQRIDELRAELYGRIANDIPGVQAAMQSGQPWRG